MNSRGQAALEYLMTYGWALIVIAIVVGVLVFIVAAPTGDVACSSNNPTKLNVVSNNIDRITGLDKFVFTNTSGGVMQSLTITTGGAMVLPGSAYTIDGAEWTPGADLGVGNHTVNITAVTATTGTYANETFLFEYTDPAGLEQSATITCQSMSIEVP